MMCCVTGKKQFFDECGYTVTGLTDKRDVADLIDRNKASLQDDVKKLQFPDKPVIRSRTALESAGLPPIRLPCHFSDDFMHTTALLKKQIKTLLRY